ncbi:MAG: type II toxin-antitoxin system HicB family antitoxin [Gemmatimonadota bacterium]|nr:type II toxin-antitoxin system HicB family antitoxin [Gemmatimonadota bacterium]
MNRYSIVIEVTETGFSAYSPDLPGCVSTSATRQEVETNMKEAIEFHLDGMKQERYPIPEPTASSTYVKVESEV